jgi:hypothetical protein
MSHWDGYHNDKVCSFTNKIIIGKKIQRLKTHTDNYKQAGTAEQNPIKMEKMAANKNDFFYKGLNSQEKFCIRFYTKIKREY